MNRPDLPQLDYVLTATERAHAAVYRCHLERLRRERNARERAAQARREAKA